MHRAAYDIGVWSRAGQVEPHLWFQSSPTGHFFLLVASQSAALWLQNSQSGRLVGHECEDGRLKTQASVRFRAEGWQALSAEAELRSPASEVRGSVRRFLRLEFVSMVAPEWRGGLMRQWRFSHAGVCELLHTARFPSMERGSPV